MEALEYKGAIKWMVYFLPHLELENYLLKQTIEVVTIAAVSKYLGVS
jgi:hypothetical protein